MLHYIDRKSALLLRVNVIGSKKSTTFENIRVYDGVGAEEFVEDFLK